MTKAFIFGMLSLILLASQPALAAQNISFGDDGGEYANDGECDDMRFIGSGMSTTSLFQEDIMHDATDCKTAHDGGKIKLNMK